MVSHIVFKNNCINNRTSKEQKEKLFSDTWTQIKLSFNNRPLLNGKIINFDNELTKYNNELARKGIFKPIKYLDIVEHLGALKDLYEYVKSFN